MSSAYRDSGFTGTTITWGSGTSAWAIVQIELDASGAAAGQPTQSRYRGVPGMNTISPRFGRGW
jgi:hypothetical protein